MSTATELWAAIAGFPAYEVSSLGAVRHTATGKIRKQPIHWKGYPVVGLMRDRVRSSHSVHRLVARAFVANNDCKPCVNHKNGIKTDNRAENLEWVTVNENNAHAAQHGLMAHGETHMKARHSDAVISAIRTLHTEGYTVKALANFFGLSDGGMRKIINCENRRPRSNHAQVITP